MKKLTKKPLYNNLYKVVSATKGEFVIEFLRGKFQGKQVTVENMKLTKHDFEDEKDVPVLVFDYNIESKRGYSEKSIKVLDNILIDVLNEIVENSIEYSKDVENYDRILDETE